MGSHLRVCLSSRTDLSSLASMVFDLDRSCKTRGFRETCQPKPLQIRPVWWQPWEATAGGSSCSLQKVWARPATAIRRIFLADVGRGAGTALSIGSPVSRPRISTSKQRCSGQGRGRFCCSQAHLTRGPCRRNRSPSRSTPGSCVSPRSEP